MDYFIGYLIQGEVADWHIDVAKKISEKFKIWKLHEKLPPHITIFYPFSTGDIRSIKNILKNWVQKRKVTGNFTISDFDHFDDNVVFAKVEIDDVVRKEVDHLRKTLKDIPEMPSDDFPIWHPHATLANRISPEEINKIWNYVQTLPKPSFLLPFDNVTIFRFEGDRKWVVEELLKIRDDRSGQQ